nr:Tex22 protein [Mus musculus]
MDSRQQRPQRRTLQWQLAQEQRQQSPPQGLAVASSQPDTKSKPQDDLQTQDWVCEPQELRRPGSRWNISIDERRRLALQRMQERTDTARAPSGDPLGLHPEGQQTETSPSTQSVPTPPLQACETMADPLQDIAHVLAELMSEGVERDVLISQPLRSTENSNAFQDFLAQDAPLWKDENFEAQTSRWPHS